MKIGIIGAGAVGSILARELNKLPENEFQLTVMARTARNGFTVLEDGIKIFHDIPVHDILSVKDTFDVLFIATKTPALLTLKETIKNMTHGNSEIIYALNGVGYDDMFAQGIPSVVYVSGQQHDKYIEHFVNQKIILPDQSFTYLDRLIQIIENDESIHFDLVKDKHFEQVRYEKLLINVGINSVTALSKNTAKIFEDDSMVRLTRTLLKESIDIVNKNSQTVYISPDFIDYAMEMYMSYPREMGTSMYYDVMANRTTEYQYIQGFVYNLKTDDHPPTPVLDTVVTLLSGYEKL